MDAPRAAIVPLLLLLPLAQAGSADGPEVEDAPDAAAPAHLDLLAAWWSSSPGGLSLSIQVRSLDDLQPLDDGAPHRILRAEFVRDQRDSPSWVEIHFSVVDVGEQPVDVAATDGQVTTTYAGRSCQAVNFAGAVRCHVAVDAETGVVRADIARDSRMPDGTSLGGLRVVSSVETSPTEVALPPLHAKEAGRRIVDEAGPGLGYVVGYD